MFALFQKAEAVPSAVMAGPLDPQVINLNAKTWLVPIMFLSA
jgi:hypothetical protein